jgi:glucokinase
MSVNYALGIDIGGTTTVGAVVSRDGRIAARKEIPTDSRKGIDDGLKRLAKLVSGLLKAVEITSANIAGIGIGATAPVDAVHGRIENPYTLPGWESIPIVSALHERFSVPVCLLGDCQIAALGEAWMGAGQTARNMLYLTVGTGIGGAFLFNGRLYRGLGDASEVGHHVIDLNGPECYCGGHGCFEILASGPAIARLAAEAPAESHLLALADGDRSRLDARLVVRAAEAGDAFAQGLVTRVGTYFGHGIANCINMLAPDHVVLGGGVMLGWAAFAPSALAIVEQRCKVVPGDQVKIAPARLGLNAGVTGAARAIWMHLAGEL